MMGGNVTTGRIPHGIAVLVMMLGLAACGGSGSGSGSGSGGGGGGAAPPEPDRLLEVPGGGTGASGGDGSGEDSDSGNNAGSGVMGAALPLAEQFHGGRVDAVRYDPATETLIIAGDPFDMTGDFRRNPERDTNGFAAFENAAGDRDYLALVRVEQGTGLAAGVVGTPYRYDTTFGGTMHGRDSAPVLPRDAEVIHLGRYAGVRNVGTNDGVDTSDSHLYRVAGDVRLALDFFADNGNVIEGAIFNRSNLDTGDVYDDVILMVTEIADDGSFTGTATVRKEPEGIYEGVIAGEGAGASAGVVVFEDPINPGPPDFERGAFIAVAE